jgi:hypothetical protein
MEENMAEFISIVTVHGTNANVTAGDPALWCFIVIIYELNCVRL